MDGMTDNTDTLDVAELRRQPTISVDRAAQFLGISRSHAYDLAKSGRLPTITLGVRRKRVPSAAVLRMLGVDDTN